MRTRVRVLKLLPRIIIEVNALVIDEIASFVFWRSASILSPIVVFLSVSVLLIAIVFFVVGVEVTWVIVSEYVVRVEPSLCH